MSGWSSNQLHLAFSKPSEAILRWRPEPASFYTCRRLIGDAFDTGSMDHKSPKIRALIMVFSLEVELFASVECWFVRGVLGA